MVVMQDAIATLILVGISAGIGFAVSLVVLFLKRKWSYYVISGGIASGIMFFIFLSFICPGPLCNVFPRNYALDFSYFNANDFTFSGEVLSISLRNNANESLVIKSISFVGLSNCFGKKEINESIENQEIKIFIINGSEYCKNVYDKGKAFELDLMIEYVKLNKLNSDSGKLYGIVS